ncbi:hypothetical protein JCM10212_006147 [Sporobolomyces blumeae]
MSSLVEPRSIERRNVAEDWGRNVQDWIQSRPPVTIFVTATIFAFLLALVVLALLWETIRKCRSSMRNSSDRERAQAEWVQLPDGSSVLTGGRVPSSRDQRRGNYRVGTYLGPMQSLIRDARQGSNGDASSKFSTARSTQNRYEPAASGATGEMIVDSQLTGGLHAAYDPPLARQPVPFQRYSTTGSSSQWSEQTRVDPFVEQNVEKDDDEIDAPAPFDPASMQYGQPVQDRSSLVPTPVPSIPPPQSAPASSSIAAAPHVAHPTSSPPALTPPLAPRTPRAFGHTRQASSGAFKPMPLQLVNATTAASASPSTSATQRGVGEGRFSTPKPTPSTTSTSESPFSISTVPTSIRDSFASSTTGWSAPTLRASPAPMGSTTMTTDPTTSDEAPRVDLERTWSLSSWIPGLDHRDKEEEEATMRLVEKAGDERRE